MELYSESDRTDESLQRLVLPCRLLGEALAQDDQFLSLEETCAAGAGSADYDFRLPQFALDVAGTGLPSSPTFTQQGLLPEIQRLWRSFDSKIMLWRYDDPGVQEVSEAVVAAAIAHPKEFVQGIDYFLVLATTLEISLHALRFAPGSSRLLPPVRTQFSVASDDVSMSALVCDPSSGRIFLGGRDGCIHELQYFDEDTRWLGRPRKCRKSAVSWNLQSQLPAILQRACVAVFGPAEAIVQLTIDVSRGLLFALSSSSITVFQVPPSQRDPSGRWEEKPVVQLCSLSQSAIASEVGRIKARIFPGLLPVGSRGLNPFGGGLVSTALPPRLVKVLPVERPVGGHVIACAVAEDGTRIFIRGNLRTAQQQAGAVDASVSGRNTARPSITSMAVHHVRFLDANAPKELRVKDALWENGVTLLHCDLPNPEGGHREGVLALSTDLRVVAQRQGRGRSPWVNVAGTAEHVDTINLTQETEGTPHIFAIGCLEAPISKPLQQFFSAPTHGLILPVKHLSELAKQQLVAAPRFMIISSIGVHILRRIQPVDTLRDQLLSGQLPVLQDFVGQYTAEQACALLFQVLTQAMPKLNVKEGLGAEKSGLGRNKGRGLSEPKGLAQAPGMLRDSSEVLLLRAEQLLLSQLAFQMGFAQALPSIEAAMRPVQPVQGWHGGSPLGYSVFQSAAHLSARMRGLYLYLSRLLRPLWLSQVMLVAWPPTEKPKRKRDDWWPPPPDPPPVAKGAQWQCAFSKSQRGFARSQLQLLKAALDHCLPRLTSHMATATGMEELHSATGALQLVAASVEALDFLELLSGCTGAMASGSCPAETLLRFSELTFRDLVCQPEARRILQGLMQAGIVAGRDLSRCPSLFSKADLEVQEAYEILKVVESNLNAAVNSSTLEIARLSHFTHRALGILERHAAQINLMEAASRLRAVGACKGLVSLCSSVARARDPKDEALRPQDPSNPRIQQLHYARLECYQVVLAILDDVLSFARQRGRLQSSFALQPASGSGRQELPELLPSRLSEFDAIPILDGLLRHCLEGHRYQADELFHFCILKWMMQSGLPPYQYKSPYLKNFLLVHAKDDPELHCRYLQHNGRWAEACDAYLTLAGKAERNPSGQEDRLLMLQNAAICARMPRSNRRVEPILRMMSETAKCHPPSRSNGAYDE